MVLDLPYNFLSYDLSLSGLSVSTSSWSLPSPLSLKMLLALFAAIVLPRAYIFSNISFSVWRLILSLNSDT